MEGIFFRGKKYLNHIRHIDHIGYPIIAFYLYVIPMFPIVPMWFKKNLYSAIIFTIIPAGTLSVKFIPFNIASSLCFESGILC
jgi:hypothetical protein